MPITIEVLRRALQRAERVQAAIAAAAADYRGFLDWCCERGYDADDGVTRLALLWWSERSLSNDDQKRSYRGTHPVIGRPD